MQKRILLLSVMAISVFWGGCQQQIVTDPGSGYVDLTIIWPSPPPGSQNKTSSTNVLLYPNKTGCVINTVAPPEITTIEVVVGGPGMSAVSATFDATTGEGTLPGVVAGPNRVARAIARDGQNIIRYAGDSQPFNVAADGVVSVEVTVALVNHAPTAPTNPNPPDGATNIPLQPSFSWDASSDMDGDPITYDFYLGTSQNPPLMTANITTNSYTPYPPGDPNSLNPNTRYYWRVVAKDPYVGTTSLTWSFNTATNENLTVPPSADSFADSAFPNTNYGSNQLLWASDKTTPSAYLRYSFIQFNLSSIPSTAFVNSAIMRLYKDSSNPNSGNMYVVCNPLVSSWNEVTINWNNKPDYDTTQSVVLEINLADAVGTSYDFDVTNMVRLMVAGTITNNGFVVRVLASNDAEIGWGSREYALSQYRPQIIVDYTP